MQCRISQGGRDRDHVSGRPGANEGERWTPARRNPKLGVSTAGVATAGAVDSRHGTTSSHSIPGSPLSCHQPRRSAARRLRHGRSLERVPHRAGEGGAVVRLVEGDRTPRRPSGAVAGNVRGGNCRNQVRTMAAGVGRRVAGIRQISGGRRARAQWRRMEDRHRPLVANQGRCALFAGSRRP